MSMLFSDDRQTPGRRPLRTMPVLALAASLAALSGCGGEPRSSTQPTAVEAAPPAAVIADSSVAAPPAPAPATVDQGPSTTAGLVEAAKRLHPTARAIDAARRAAEARIAQAGAWVNPELEVSVGRTRPRVDDVERDTPIGATYSQRHEWWGKRRARIAAAEADAAAALADVDSALLDLEIEVRLASIAYATAREALNQATTQATLATELVDVVAKRQAAGDIDLAEAARIRVEASIARVRQQAATRAVATSLAVLRTWCGDQLPDDLVLTDVFAETGVDGATAALHPRIRSAIEAERAAEARLQAERSARVPDLTIGVFGEREWDQDTLGLTFGIELPVWNRNASGIAIAEAERERLSAERKREELRLRRERTEAVGAWELARAEAMTLKDEAVPAARDAVRLRTTAFTSGDASLADVLDARRVLLSVETDLLDAQRRQAEAQVRLLATTTAPGNHP